MSTSSLWGLRAPALFAGVQGPVGAVCWASMGPAGSTGWGPQCLALGEPLATPALRMTTSLGAGGVTDPLNPSSTAVPSWSVRDFTRPGASPESLAGDAH